MLQRLLVCVLLLSVDPALAEDAWDRDDTALEILFLSLHAIDWGQTRQIAEDCEDGKSIHEHNPFLGECPTLHHVDGYFIISGIAQYALARLLPTSPRRYFVTASILLSARAVRTNIRAGVALRF